VVFAHPQSIAAHFTGHVDLHVRSSEPYAGVLSHHHPKLHRRHGEHRRRASYNYSYDYMYRLGGMTSGSTTVVSGVSYNAANQLLTMTYPGAARRGRRIP